MNQDNVQLFNPQNLGLTTRAHLNNLLDHLPVAEYYSMNALPHFGEYLLNLVEVQVAVRHVGGDIVDWDDFAARLCQTPFCLHERQTSQGVEARVRRSFSLDNFQYIRADRFLGSIQTNMDWLSHVNTWAEADMYLSFCIIDDAPGPATEISLEVAYQLQERILFAIINLQLSPVLARKLLPQVAAFFNMVDVSVALPYRIPIVDNALSQFVTGYGNVLQDGDSLATWMDSNHGYLILEQLLRNNWIVMVTPRTVLDQSQIGHRITACYVGRDVENMLPFVILPTRRVGRSHTPVMLCFTVEPTIEMVQIGLDAFEVELQQSHCMLGQLQWHLVTRPFAYSSVFGEHRRIFRPDGRLNNRVWASNLSGLIRLALQNNTTLDRGWDMVENDQLTDPIIPNEPQNVGIFNSVALYLRVSSENQIRYSDGLARQLCYILPKIFGHIGDIRTMHVIAECTSSWGYSWSSRRSWLSARASFTTADRPMMVVTVTPDRLTRRAEDLAEIHAQFDRYDCSWFSFDVDPQNRHELLQIEAGDDDVTARLDQSINVSRQHSFYTDTALVMTRSWNEIRELSYIILEEARLESYHAQRHLVTDFCLRRRITDVVVLTRGSPTWLYRQDDTDSNQTLRRQREFCSLFLDRHAVQLELIVLELDFVSAYSEQTLNQLRERLDGRNDVLILASSMDRITRRMTHLDEFVQWRERNTWVMSFIWQQRHFPVPTNAVEVAALVDADVVDLPVTNSIVRSFEHTAELHATGYGLPLVMPVVLTNRTMPFIRATIADAENFVSQNNHVIYASTTLPRDAPIATGRTRGINQNWVNYWTRYITELTGLRREQVINYESYVIAGST
ncbi:unnamed protein product [Umbelopsis sp. WA50703]